MDICFECKNCIKVWIKSSCPDDITVIPGFWSCGCKKHPLNKIRNNQTGDYEFKDTRGYTKFFRKNSKRNLLERLFGIYNYDELYFKKCENINPDGKCKEYEAGKAEISN